MRGFSRATRSIPALVIAAAFTGCGYLPVQPGPGPVSPPDYTSIEPEAPVSGHEYVLTEDADLIGETQVILTRDEDTLSDIARRFNLGYLEMRLANPDIDPWLPGENTPVYLPTRYILPDAPRQGMVLNVATMRLFYYRDGPETGSRRVLTHPIGIGQMDWATPTGDTTVVGKARDPVWYVPKSIRAEHAAAGDPLPPIVQPGPDNPLGEYVLQLGMPGYLIHGTNKPYGVGMRISHGCVRLYPEDIAPLYEDVARGTPVYIVNQPFLVGWHDGTLYLEAHQPLDDDTRDRESELIALISAAIDEAGYPERKIDWQRSRRIADMASGVPVPISKRSPGADAVFAGARYVQNTLPPLTNLDVDPALKEPEESTLAQFDDE